MKLNERTSQLTTRLLEDAERLRVEIHRTESGARLIDAGGVARGGLEAGLALARVCLSDLATVQLTPGDSQVWAGPAVSVATDWPVTACMRSQYAGWQIAGEKFFAMGSGPMRGAAGREALFEQIGGREQAEQAIGVLETAQFPPDDVCRQIAQQCGVAPHNLTLWIARTASQAGNLQVVARSVETALHKLHELGFDLTRVQAGFGTAPLPPVAADDLAGIGRTNDAILYGGQVTLWVTGDDDSLADIVARVPSNASADHGAPFAEIFARYDRDFYRIDPHLFSPAVVTLMNVDSGVSHRSGQCEPKLLARSFQS